ncbi:MAG: hypothetical protein HLX45_05180 [Bacillus sp. (in: Bacteria)]|nr:hypothetical protein [Bacillus sp. (in: firmicutes)]
MQLKREEERELEAMREEQERILEELAEQWLSNNAKKTIHLYLVQNRTRSKKGYGRETQICGKKLPFHHQYAICDRCYERRFFYF